MDVPHRDFCSRWGGASRRIPSLHFVARQRWIWFAHAEPIPHHLARPRFGRATGYMNSWNICAEGSDAPDWDMLRTLVDRLATYENVNQDAYALGDLQWGGR